MNKNKSRSLISVILLSDAVRSIWQARFFGSTHTYNQGRRFTKNNHDTANRYCILTISDLLSYEKALGHYVSTTTTHHNPMAWAKNTSGSATQQTAAGSRCHIRTPFSRGIIHMHPYPVASLTHPSNQVSYRSDSSKARCKDSNSRIILHAIIFQLCTYLSDTYLNIKHQNPALNVLLTFSFCQDR